MQRHLTNAIVQSKKNLTTQASLRGSLHRVSSPWISALFPGQRDTSTLSFATVDPKEVSGSQPCQMYNLVDGKWQSTSKWIDLLDPLNGQKFIRVPDTSTAELKAFVESLRACPKSGLHNPLKNPERYLLMGDVSSKAAYALKQPEVESFFATLIQRVSPKSYAQALGEVTVTQKFLENFSGDQLIWTGSFLARSFAVPGNHAGQQSTGLRWPYGPVAIITPFNFPLEIPVLQLLGALFMGNKPLLKVDSKVSLVMEQFLRLLHECGLPPADADFINSDGPVMNRLLLEAEPKMTLFTGSSTVAEKLAVDLKGRVKLEDAGFDWKILGPDVQNNWAAVGFVGKLKELAARRKLEDLTVGPVLTVTTERMLEHVQKLLTIPGAHLAFGGKPLENHNIPSIYGAVEPTAVFVPLKEMLKSKENFEAATTEIFGPFQILTEYKQEDLPLVLEACERMHAHLTAAVVSNDVLFLQEVLSSTVNGTTYAGIRARTTGAPQNHWFGPAGDPRGAGIGTPEAIKLVWSCHREIIHDVGAIPKGWQTPEST